MPFAFKLSGIDFRYNTGEILLDRCTVFKDLGVTFDPQLSFSRHIPNTCSKAIQVLGFIKRNSSDFTTVDTLKCLFRAFVIFIFQYCSVVWNPCCEKYVCQIDSIQKKFLHPTASIVWYDVHERPEDTVSISFSISIVKWSDWLLGTVRAAQL